MTLEIMAKNGLSEARNDLHPSYQNKVMDTTVPLKVIVILELRMERK